MNFSLLWVIEMKVGVLFNIRIFILAAENGFHHPVAEVSPDPRSCRCNYLDGHAGIGTGTGTNWNCATVVIWTWPTLTATLTGLSRGM